MMEEGKTAIVDFVSERCPHCTAIAPTFEELANKFSSDKVEFYVIDAEKLDDVSFEVGGITSVNIRYLCTQQSPYTDHCRSVSYIHRIQGR
jgi:thiol-disulfide isomerase/thioredoxin